MGMEWIKQKIRFLIFLLLLSSIYSGLLYSHIPLTTIIRIDGTVGVILGIYVCAHPAANLADVILYGRYLAVLDLPKSTLIFWWIVNALVMFSGLLVFVLGLLRYSDYS
jgi:hypothetical protein